MPLTRIHRDATGLARTHYCQEIPDGGLDLLVGDLRYQLSPERIADGPAFAQTLLDLRPKRWFTEAVQCDLTNVVTARWLALARGWVEPGTGGTRSEKAPRPRDNRDSVTIETAAP